MSRTYEQLEPVISALDERIKTGLGAFPTDTAEGSVASFPDGANDIPLKSLVVDINPVQDTSSGDPSPTNICPISGWTGCNVAASGKNVFGGNALKESVLANIPNATSGTDANGDYVSFTPSNANNKELFTALKPNTQYTLIMRLAKNNTTTSTNIQVKYTDNTYTALARIGVSENTPETVVLTTPAGKSIKSVSGIWQSGTTYLYYDQCGVFEGVLTADDFEPYNGQTIPIDWQTEAGTVYGGHLDVLNGVLTVDMAMVDLGTFTWTYDNTSYDYGFFSSGNIPSKAWGSSNIICSQYKTVHGGRNMLTSNATICPYNTSTSGAICVRDDAYTDAATFKTAMSGVQTAYELKTPIEIQLDAHTVSSLYGQNNIWADTGDSTVEYRADTKLYIERLTEPDADMIADANITSGQYFMVGNSLYLATANIASGGQVIVGTNCTHKSLSEALNEINQ